MSKRQRGFSILELMVVLTLFGILFSGLQEPVLVGLRSLDSADDREDLRMQLTRTLDRFTREATMARGVSRAQEQRFRFDADFNGDGDSGDSGENNIDYQVTGTTLTRAQGGTTITLISNLTSASAADVFNYYETDTPTTESDTCDATGSCGSNCCRSDVRVVVIALTVTRGNETISMSSSAFLENM